MLILVKDCLNETSDKEVVPCCYKDRGEDD